MNRYFSIILIFLSCYSLGQKSLVFELADYNTNNLQFLDGNKYWVIGLDIKYIDLQTNEVSTIISRENRLGTYEIVKVVNDKLFLLGNKYVDSIRENRGYLASVDLSGNILLDTVFREALHKNGIIEHSQNSILVYTSNSNGEAKVWNSDGSQEGTFVIETGKDIESIYVIDGEPIYIVNQGDRQFIQGQYKGQNQIILVPLNVPNISKILFHNEKEIYFETAEQDTFSKYSIWGCNIENKSFRLIDPEATPNANYDVRNGFYYSAPQTWASISINTLGIKKVSLEGADIVKLDARSDNNQRPVLYHFAKNLVQFYTDETGYELAHYIGDSLILHDFNKGPGSSVLSYDDRYYSPLFYKDSVYAIMTNGNDLSQYLYRLSENGSKTCVAVLDESLGPRISYSNPFIYDDKLYWWSFNVSGLYDSAILYSTEMYKNIQQPTDKVLKSEWYRQVVQGSLRWQMGTQRQLYPIKTSLTKSNEVVTLCHTNQSYYGGYQLFDQFNYDTTARGGTNYILKYDSLGNRLWTANFGSIRYSRSYEYPISFELDKNDDIILSGLVFQGMYWNNYFEDFGGSIVKRYLAKLDGETGEFLWYKTFYDTRYSNVFSFDKMTLDDENNIYVAAMYEDFQLSLEGQSINSTKSPANVLLKYDSEGTFLWMESMETPWLDRFGNTHVLEYDKINGHVLAVQSQDWFNTSSSCNWDSSDVYFQFFSLVGVKLRSKQYSTDDMFSITSGDFDSQGKLYVKGYYRGNYQIGNFGSETEDNCQYRGFSLSLNGNKETTLYTSRTRIEPIKLKVDGDYKYSLIGVYNGSSSSFANLVLLKQDLSSNYIGHKWLGQREYDEDIMFNSFDINEDKIVLAGNYANNNKLGMRNLVFPYRDEGPYFSLLFINNENWSTDSTWFVPVEVNLEKTIADFKVYPNPAYKEVTIALPGTSNQYTEYAIYDLKGAEIFRGKLSSDLVQTINVAYLNQGIFILRCFDDKEAIAAKIIKM